MNKQVLHLVHISKRLLKFQMKAIIVWDVDMLQIMVSKRERRDVYTSSKAVSWKALCVFSQPGVTVCMEQQDRTQCDWEMCKVRCEL